MSKFKGTKGEWFISEINGEFITTDDTNVCRVFKMESKEGNANAKLISCAPEMLETHIEEVKKLKQILRDLPLGLYEIALELKHLIHYKEQLIKKATEI